MSQALTKTNSGQSLIQKMAEVYQIAPEKFLATLKATVFPSGKPVTEEQIIAFLVVANRYTLNMFIKEIYAFPGRAGGIIPIVSVDGWATLINREEKLDGIEFVDQLNQDGFLVAVTCRIYRKDRSHPTEVTEYMAECKRDTDPWRQWPNRMLRHKSLIQAARYAFGFAGIYDPDEAERIANTEAISVPAAPRNVTQILTAPRQIASTPRPDPVTIDAEVEDVAEPDPKPKAKAKGKAEKPAEPMDVDAETQRQRELVFAMFNDMPLKAKDQWLQEHDMQSVNEVNKWDIDMCVAALEN